MLLLASINAGVTQRIPYAAVRRVAALTQEAVLEGGDGCFAQVSGTLKSPSVSCLFRVERGKLGEEIVTGWFGRGC